MPRSLRTLIPKLPRRVWIVLAGDALSALGSGLVLPFLVVYLRDVRGLDVQTAALVVSTLAVVALAAGPLTGTLIDRYGSRELLIASLVFCAMGSIGFSSVHAPWQAFLAAAVFGTGIAGMWPATHSLLTGLVTVEQRSSVFAVHYATLNAGIGTGGIIGGLVANVNDPHTFEWLYRIDALTWLAFAALLFVLKDVGRLVPAEEEVEERGYRHVFRDRVFMRLMAVMTLLVTIGYSQLESGFPAYATGTGGISTRALGAAFAANTFVIVLAQLFVLRATKGRRRTRALMLICALWATAWSMTLLAGQLDAGMAKNIGFALSMAIFALGECLVSPTTPAILNDLAPNELRGRYNAVYSLTFSLGHIAGPAFAGLMLGAGLGEELFGVLIVACGLAALLVRSLESRISEAANLGIADEGEPSEERELSLA